MTNLIKYNPEQILNEVKPEELLTIIKYVQRIDDWMERFYGYEMSPETQEAFDHICPNLKEKINQLGLIVDGIKDEYKERFKTMSKFCSFVKVKDRWI